MSPSESESSDSSNPHGANGDASPPLGLTSPAEDNERSLSHLEAGMAGAERGKAFQAREGTAPAPLLVSEPENNASDPNIVTWDGPDDPSVSL